MTNAPRNSGFTLMEILVATTILLVIVVMCSMVFQQQSGAFQSGRDKVSSQSALRTVLSSVLRDLSCAVYDERNSFSGSSISFYANIGDGEDGKSPKKKVTYSGGAKITRHVEGEETAVLYESGNGKPPITMTFEKTDGYFTDSDGRETSYPRSVSARLSVPTSSSSVNISARSLGQNRRDDTSGDKVGDDIWVGAGRR